jgi:hypothetical protein
VAIKQNMHASGFVWLAYGQRLNQTDGINGRLNLLEFSGGEQTFWNFPRRQ